MENRSKYLKVESRENGSIITITANNLGLSYLKERIEELLEYEANQLPVDTILMTEECGGVGLTTDTIYQNNILVEVLKIIRWE